MSTEKHLQQDTGRNRFSGEKQRRKGIRLDWRIIIALILVLVSLFLLLKNVDKFSTYRGFVNGEEMDVFDEDFKEKVSRDIVSLKGTGSVKAPFVAEDNRISMVGLPYFCLRGDNRQGRLTVSITDSEGNVLAQEDMDITKLRKKTLGYTSFQDSDSGVVKVRKGETYYIVAATEGVTSDEDFGIYYKKTEDGIYSVVVYSYLKKKVIVLYIVLILLAAEIVLLLPGRGRRKDPDDAGRRATGYFDSIILWLMFFATPFVCFFLAEKITGKNFGTCARGLFTYSGILNVVIIGLIWWIIYLLSGRKKAAVIGMTLLNIAFLLVNFALIQFRSTPFLFNDVVEAKTAAMVAKNYKMIPDQHAIGVIIITLLWIAVAIAFRERKILPMKGRAVALIAAVIWGWGLYSFIMDGTSLKEHEIKMNAFEPLETYTNEGYYLSYVLSAKESRIEKPEGYSIEAVKAITSRYTSDTADNVTKTTKRTPNVIVIMNESFTDLDMLKKIDTDNDVIPFYNSLKENTIKGKMHASVYGGHTAVSEFEFLTGNSQRFLPVNSVPYTGFVGENTPSIARDLKKRGYGGITAFHPGYAESYNRDIVYPNMGFDIHISSESMNYPSRVRNFISDEEDYRRVITEYEKYRKSEKKRPYFMFNVTIQNHGAYTLEGGVVEPRQIEITDNSLQYEELGQFLNLMKISDQALEQLVTYFSKVDEPTVIMMFGDHQPKVEQEFYDTAYADRGKLSKIEKLDMKYWTPFMIWANYDIPEQEGLESSANLLQNILLDSLDAPMTGYQKFLSDIRKEMPVFSDKCIVDKNGKLYSRDDSTPYDELIREYNILEYNMLVDRKHTETGFFSLR